MIIEHILVYTLRHQILLVSSLRTEQFGGAKKRLGHDAIDQIAAIGTRRGGRSGFLLIRSDLNAQSGQFGFQGETLLLPLEFLMTGMMLGLLLEILKLQVLKSLSIALQGIAHQLQLLLQAGIVWFLLQHGTQSEK